MHWIARSNLQSRWVVTYKWSSRLWRAIDQRSESPKSAITIDRYRPKGVFGKGVGNSQNASEMRQKYVKNASEMRQNGSCLIGKRGTSKMRQKSVKIASKMRQKYAEHLWGRTPFGRYRIEWRADTKEQLFVQESLRSKCL